MKVSELIEQLKECHPNQQVVIDLIEGAHSILDVSGDGEINTKEGREKVVWISLKENLSE